MRDKIGLKALKGINVLYENDLYDLADFLLKINEAKSIGTNSRSRHTVHGVASAYSMVADVSHVKIISILQTHGLPLGATVEYDDDV